MSGSKHVLNNAVQSHLASPSNIYRMHLCKSGCNLCECNPKPNKSDMLLTRAEAPCAIDDGQIRWGREAHRALFGKKMPAAANIDSVAVNGVDGLRSQWREEIN